MNTPPIKLLVVSPVCAGKTTVIRRFTTGVFKTSTSAMIGAEFTRHSLTVDVRPAVVDIWNLAGQDRFMELRQTYYRSADVVVICFNVDSPSCFDTVIDRDYQHLRQHAPGIPFILVGTQVDRRNDPDYKDHRFVSREEGQAAADRIGAHKYVECSAKTGEGVSVVFYEACKAVYLPLVKDGDRRRKNRKERK